MTTELMFKITVVMFVSNVFLTALNWWLNSQIGKNFDSGIELFKKETEVFQEINK